jgi:hypothetical protein
MVKNMPDCGTPWGSVQAYIRFSAIYQLLLGFYARRSGIKELAADGTKATKLSNLNCTRPQCGERRGLCGANVWHGIARALAICAT